MWFSSTLILQLLLLHYHSLFLGIILVAKGHECGGAERFKGYRRSLWACARACERSSDMIVFGTNEFGVNRCKGGRCACYCEDDTIGKCNGKRIEHKGYNLYSKPINSKGKCTAIPCWTKIRQTWLQKLCLIYWYKSLVKIRQNGRNFGLMTKILWNEIFVERKSCPRNFCPIRYGV